MTFKMRYKPEEYERYKQTCVQVSSTSGRGDGGDRGWWGTFTSCQLQHASLILRVEAQQRGGGGRGERERVYIWHIELLRWCSSLLLFEACLFGLTMSVRA